ncbi:MAG: acyl carrier protein [Labrys sp. (in: a-proteobacteria)]|jgi:acyl carrier protein
MVDTPPTLKNLDANQVYGEIVEIIIKEGMVDRSLVTPDATFESMGLKSVDLVMILTAVEEKYNTYIPMDESVADAKDLRSFIEGVITRLSAGAS